MAKKNNQQDRRESGLPGGGSGRRDEVGGSGVYPMSGPHPPGDVPVVTEAAWGQGKQGAAGYDESGRSEIYIPQTNPEQCRDIMTKDPVCCTASDTVEECARVMRDRDIGAVPIVADEKDKRLVGIVTDRDIVLQLVSEGRNPRQTRVDDIMSRDPATCSPEDGLQQCMDTMEARQVRRMPVVDNRGRIVGVIAQADIATRMRAPDKLAEVVREVSKPKVMGGAG